MIAAGTFKSEVGKKAIRWWKLPHSAGAVFFFLALTAIAVITGGSLSAQFAPARTALPVWNRQGAVISPDKLQAITAEPTVFYEQGSQLGIAPATTVVFKMWFSTVGNIRGTSYAESLDGINWTQYAGNPILADRYRNFVVKVGVTYYMYVANEDDTQIDEYTSLNGLNFALDYANVIANGSNSGGIISNGTLYLYVECREGIKLYTSTDFHSFTDAGLMMSAIYQYQGPTVPYFLNRQWYIWIGDGNGTEFAVTERWTSPALTGPWTKVTVELSPVTDDEGANTPYGETIDPWIMQVGNSTYLFYEGNQGTADWVQEHELIKLAIIPVPLSTLVLRPSAERLYPRH